MYITLALYIFATGINFAQSPLLKKVLGREEGKYSIYERNLDYLMLLLFPIVAILFSIRDGGNMLLAGMSSMVIVINIVLLCYADFPGEKKISIDGNFWYIVALLLLSTPKFYLAYFIFISYTS